MVESSKMNNFLWLYIEWYLLCEEFLSVPFWTTLSVAASQKVGLLTLKKWKVEFFVKHVEIVGRQHCLPCHNAHMCQIRAHILTNYVMNVAKTLLVSLERYECLFMIASFWEHVSIKLLNCKFIFFMVTRSLVMVLREGFRLFWFFIISYACLKI